MMQTRLYGTKSLGSFEIVTTGLERALKSLEILAGLRRTDSEDTDDSSGGGAPRAILVGNPFLSKLMHFWGAHDETWLMLAPNSEGIPNDIVADLSQPVFSLRLNREVPTLTGLYAPSKWAVGVLERAFSGRVPVKLLRHGVLPEFVPIPANREATLRHAEGGGFNVVHATSTFHERKGTRALIKAWAAVEKEIPKAQILITAQPNVIPIYADVAALAGCKRVSFMPNHSLPRAQWVGGISGAHAVIQPSRSEGFGLVPLEARACGIPVVATACTGHSEHMPSESEPGAVVIPHGGLEPVDDYSGAIAPAVSVDDIRDSILTLHGNYRQHHEAAMERSEEIRKRWAWETVIKEDLL